MTTPGDAQRDAEAADLLRAYCSIRSQQAARSLLLDHPELVGLASARFALEVAGEADQLDPLTAAQWRCRLDQLSAAREVGVEIAFDVMVHVDERDASAMYAAFNDDERVGSADALLGLFADYPGLVSLAVAETLDSNGARLRELGDAHSAAARTMQSFLIRRCISVGVHAGIVQTLAWNEETGRRRCTVEDLATDQDWLAMAVWVGDFCGPDTTLADRLAMLADGRPDLPKAARYAELMVRAGLPDDCLEEAYWGAVLLDAASRESQWDGIEQVVMELSFVRGLVAVDNSEAQEYFTEHMASFGRRAPDDPAGLLTALVDEPVEIGDRLRQFDSLLQRQERDIGHLVHHLFFNVTYWSEVESILFDHPELCSPLAVQIVDDLLADWREQDSERSVFLIEGRRRLLLACTEVGVKAAVRAATIELSRYDAQALSPHFEGGQPSVDLRYWSPREGEEPPAFEVGRAACMMFLDKAEGALARSPEGDIQALGSALWFLERAIEATEPGTSHQALALGYAADVHQLRADLTGNRADADQAIGLAQEAMDCEHGELQHPWEAPLRLASLLLQRHGQEGDPADLGTAFLTLGPLLATIAEGNPAPPAPPPAQMLVKLHELHGQAHFEATRATRSISDMAAAADALQRAVAACPDGHPKKATIEGMLDWVKQLLPGGGGPLGEPPGPRGRPGNDHPDTFAAAQRLWTAHEQNARQVPVDELRDALAAVMRSEHPRNAIWAGTRLGELEAANGHWQASAAAYRTTIDLVHQVRRRQTADHQTSWLRAASAVFTEGAYALLQAGEREQAVLTLEGGRACVLSDLIAARRVDRLRTAGHEDLADDFEHTTAALRGVERSELIAARQGRTPNRAQAERLRERLNELADRIGALDDLPDPYAPPDLATVRAAADPAPLVYLTATRFGGAALVVHGNGTIDAVDLAELTAQAATAHARQFLDARHAADGRWPTVLETVTRWLWQAGMGPVVDALGSTPHAVLVPTGPLGVLPLHAAWIRDPTAPTGRRYALDELLLTYTVNARALLTARDLTQRQVNDRTLVIVEPLPTSGARLPGAFTEARRVIARGRGISVAHQEATRHRVLDALAHFGYLHFICHGATDLAHPLESGLLLADDERLTLADFLFTDLSGTRLAVLSACETAMVGGDLPDEVLSLPGGLLQAGIPGVIGSQWSVPDQATVELMSLFYDLARGGDGMPCAEALRRAQQQVRDATAAEKRSYFGGPPLAPGPLVPDQARPQARPHHWAAFCLYGV